MFVTNHVLSGALLGHVFDRRPVTAFLAGLGSHLILDAIPHWGCDFERPDWPEQFLRIARRDGVLGLVTVVGAAIAVDRGARVATVAAITGAVVLDLDKPCEYFAGLNPFPAAVQRLHKWVQNEAPTRMANEIAYGIVFAATDAVAIAVQRRRVQSPMTVGQRR